MPSDPPAAYVPPTAAPAAIGAVYAVPSAPAAPPAPPAAAAAAPGAIGAVYAAANSAATPPDVFIPGRPNMLVVSGVTDPGGMNGTAEQSGLENGKVAFNPPGYVAGSAGTGLRCYWFPTGGGYWTLMYIVNGSQGSTKRFASTSQVSSPELATGWTPVNSATGTPVVSLAALAAPPAITP